MTANVDARDVPVLVEDTLIRGDAVVVPVTFPAGQHAGDWAISGYVRENAEDVVNLATFSVDATGWPVVVARLAGAVTAGLAVDRCVARLRASYLGDVHTLVSWAWTVQD